MNKLWTDTDDVPGTVAELNNVFAEATKKVMEWVTELGNDKPMEQRGDSVTTSTGDSVAPSTEEDGNDNTYVLYTLHPIPTAEEAAIKIWDAAVDGDASVAAEAAEAAVNEANKPGAKWAHEPVRIPLPDILKGIEFPESPSVMAAAGSGYINAPLSKELGEEVWSAGRELRHEYPALTRPLNLAGRLLANINAHFDNGTSSTRFTVLTAASEVWLKTPAEVEDTIDDLLKAYDAVSAELAATEAEELEAKADPDDLEGVDKWVSTLWNDVAQVEEWGRDDVAEARRAAAEEARKNFRVYFPDAFREHATVADHKLKETFQAPLAADAWVKRKLTPLAEAIVADMDEPRATRLAALHVRELLRIFADDCELRGKRDGGGRR